HTHKHTHPSVDAKRPSLLQLMSIAATCPQPTPHVSTQQGWHKFCVCIAQTRSVQLQTRMQRSWCKSELCVVCVQTSSQHTADTNLHNTTSNTQNTTQQQHHRHDVHTYHTSQQTHSQHNTQHTQHTQQSKYTATTAQTQCTHISQHTHTQHNTQH